MKCGSTRPVAMRRSASTKRRSSLTGVPRVRVTPKSTCAASSRAKWLSTSTVSSTHGSPTTSASSSPSFGRCRPVATSTVMRSRGMPAASRPSISGRRNRWLGTGRVMSQMRMHALRRPRTSSAYGGAPTGWASAARTAASRVGELRQRALADQRRLRAGRQPHRSPVLPYRMSSVSADEVVIEARSASRGASENGGPMAARRGRRERAEFTAATRCVAPDAEPRDRAGLGVRDRRGEALVAAARRAPCDRAPSAASVAALRASLALVGRELRRREHLLDRHAGRADHHLAALVGPLLDHGAGGGRAHLREAVVEVVRHGVLVARRDDLDVLVAEVLRCAASRAPSPR